MYLEIKTTHICLVSMSVLLFFLRAYWMANGSLSSRGTWVKRLPHFIDTGILLSGLCLIKLTHFTPVNSAWLALKLTLLLVYIISGAFALHYGGDARARLIYFLVAASAITGIVLLATLKPVL